MKYIRMHTQKNPKRSSLAAMNAVFNGGTVLVGVCLTLISLFQITDKRALYIVDEVFGILSLLFTLSIVFSYMHIRNTTENICRNIATYLFSGTLILMFFSGLLLIMEL